MIRSAWLRFLLFSITMLTLASCDTLQEIGSGFQIEVVAPPRLGGGATAVLRGKFTGLVVSNKSVDWSIVSGGGTLSASSGEEVTYTAPLVNSKTTVTVRGIPQATVSKATNAYLYVKPPEVEVQVTTAPKVMAFGDSSELVAEVKPDLSVPVSFAQSKNVTWTIVSGGGQLSNPTGSKVTFTAPNTNDNNVVVLKVVAEANPLIEITLKLRVLPPGPCLTAEPNDTRETAALLETGTIQAAFCGANERDFYKFRLETPKVVTFTIAAPGLEKTFQPKLEIFTASNRSANNIWASGLSNSGSEAVLFPPGDYYAKIDNQLNSIVVGQDIVYGLGFGISDPIPNSIFEGKISDVGSHYYAAVALLNHRSADGNNLPYDALIDVQSPFGDHIFTTVPSIAIGNLASELPLQTRISGIYTFTYPTGAKLIRSLNLNLADGLVNAVQDLRVDPSSDGLSITVRSKAGVRRSLSVEVINPPPYGPTSILYRIDMSQENQSFPLRYVDALKNGEVCRVTVVASSSSNTIPLDEQQVYFSTVKRQFVVGQVPILDASVQLEASASGGGIVKIHGTNLVTIQQVTINGQLVPFEMLSETEFQLTVPPGSGSIDIIARNQVGSSNSVKLNYREPTTYDLTIAGMYVTQVIQTLDGSVPLVAGKPGVLRVFAVSNHVGGEKSKIRIQGLRNGTPLGQYEVSIESSLPTQPNEANLIESANIQLPIDWLQPGLQLIAEVDPDNAIVEANENNNRFPTNNYYEPSVVVPPPLQITFVPVTINEIASSFVASDIEYIMSDVRKLMPITEINADVHIPFTASEGLITGGKLINLLEGLAIAEGRKRYYLGFTEMVLEIEGFGKGSGQGKLGGTIAWAYREPSVVTHELGHNWNRKHAPCGNPPDPDLNYPISGGGIGSWGFDLTTMKPVDSSFADLMGYCFPDWISPYTYKGVLDWRQNRTQVALQASPTIQSILLIRGSILQGRVDLAPAFQIDTTPTPPTPGKYQLEALNQAGQVIHVVPFAPQEIADSNGAMQTFAFTIPFDSQIESLRVTQANGSALATRERSGASRARAKYMPSSAKRLDQDRVEVTWDAAYFPEVIVRDGKGGSILSFASGGRIVVRPKTEMLELIRSDGIITDTEFLTY